MKRCDGKLAPSLFETGYIEMTKCIFAGWKRIGNTLFGRRRRTMTEVFTLVVTVIADYDPSAGWQGLAIHLGAALLGRVVVHVLDNVADK